MDTILKYKNRKIYSKTSSSYVTLAELGEMVRNGEEFQVICNTTKRDITAETLTRLVFENTLTGTPLKIDTLQRILCKGDGSLGSYFA
jgi:Uncharacterized protein conserved in bacteria